MTRAEEQLYIISEKKKDFDEPTMYSQFFIDFLTEKGLWNSTQHSFSFGDPQRLSKPKKTNQNNIEQETFISSDWRQLNINIIPKTKKAEDKTEDARQYGNLIHEILAQIYNVNDIENVIYTYALKGLIAINSKENITSIIKNVVLNNELRPYFTDAYEILNEREILTNTGDILIPDKLAIHNEQVIIIDYKTGKQEKAHHRQVNSYAVALEQMGYNVVKKLLVYIDEDVLVVNVY